MSYQFPSPLANDQILQRIRENEAAIVGTVVSVQGVDGNGRGKYKDVTYSVAYRSGDAYVQVNGVRPTAPEWDDLILVNAAKPGARALVIRRGDVVEFEIFSSPYILTCETP